MKGKVRTPWKLLVGLLLGLALFIEFALAGPALAQESLSIDFGNRAALIDGGQAVELKVRVRCTLENHEVLEAFVYVVQDGNQSNFAPLPVTCGQPGVQVLEVTVGTLDFLFHRGAATATGFILLLDPVTGDTLSAGATESIRIR